MAVCHMLSSERVCANCKRFRQYYAQQSQEVPRSCYLTVNAGQCLWNGYNRKPGSRACGGFISRFDKKDREVST